MNRWIRWQGLLAFTVILAVVLLVWFVFLDAFVKRGIESLGTKIVGAKVEVAKADVSLLPLGITITGLQVTDPDEPMRNALEIKRIAGAIVPQYLLRGKLIIEELSVEGVQLGTPRKRSGALPSFLQHKSPQIEQKSDSKLPRIIEPPNIKDILARENLQSLALAESLVRTTREQKALWNQTLATLPNKEKIASYRQRLDNLRGGGKLFNVGSGALNDSLALFSAIKADLKTLQKAQRDLEASIKKLDTELGTLEWAPSEDIRRLSNKYAFTTQGAANFSKLFLVPQIANWVDRALLWRARLAPLLARVGEKKGKAEVVKPIRAKGLDVRFPEKAPLPDFLIRVAKVSLILDSGRYTGLVRNITPDQSILGAPLTFSFSGKDMPSGQAINIEGAIDRVLPNSSQERLAISVAGYRLSNLKMFPGAFLPIKMKSANADMKIKVLIKNDTFTGNMEAAMEGVHFTSEQPPSSDFDKALYSVLTGASRLSLRAQITGGVDKYDLQVASNLDELVVNAINTMLRVQIARFEEELRGEIMARLGATLQDAKQERSDLDSLLGDLQNRISSLLGIQSEGEAKSSPLRGIKLPSHLPISKF